MTPDETRSGCPGGGTGPGGGAGCGVGTGFYEREVPATADSPANTTGADHGKPPKEEHSAD